jgi:uncharacterized protein YggE
MRSSLIVLVMSVFAASAMAAEATAQRMITVSGSAERKITPDQAHINVNISGLDGKLENAKAQHDKKLKDVIAIAKSAGIDAAQIKTQNSSIQPQYTYDNNKRQFKGYQVQTSLDILVKKVDDLGGVIEKLSSAKLESAAGNEWQGLLNVNYTLADPDKIRDEMLADAIKNARAKADRMAAAADAKIGRVVNIAEGGVPSFNFPLPPVPMMARAMSMKAGAAMENDAAMAPPPGEQQVNANVTVSFELKD